MTEFEQAEQRLRLLMKGESKESIYAGEFPKHMQRDVAHTCYVLDLQTIVRGWFDIDRPLVMAAKDLLAAVKAAREVLDGLPVPGTAKVLAQIDAAISKAEEQA